MDWIIKQEVGADGFGERYRRAKQATETLMKNNVGIGNRLRIPRIYTMTHTSESQEVENRYDGRTQYV